MRSAQKLPDLITPTSINKMTDLSLMKTPYRHLLRNQALSPPAATMNRSLVWCSSCEELTLPYVHNVNDAALFSRLFLVVICWRIRVNTCNTPVLTD